MATKVHIVHVISGDLWAGAESLLFNLVRVQKGRKEFNVRVVVFNKGILFERIYAFGIPIVLVPEAKKSVMSMIVGIREEIKSEVPLIVHTHGFKEDILVAVARIGCGLTKVIRTVHGLPESAIEGLMLKKRMVRWLESFLIRKYDDMVVSVSSAMDAQMKIVIPSNRRAIVHNGIDCCALTVEKTPPEVAQQDKCFRVGFFGRLVPVKRFDLLIQVFEEISKQLTEPVSFFIVGDGPEMRSLKMSISESPIKKDIHLLGFRQDVVDLLSNMDSIVLTSDHEGLPMVCLEALCLGIPILSRAVGDVPQLLCEHAAGVTVDTDDPVVLANAGASILRSGRKRSGFAPLKSKYTAIGMDQAYQKIYERVIGPLVVSM